MKITDVAKINETGVGVLISIKNINGEELECNYTDEDKFVREKLIDKHLLVIHNDEYTLKHRVLKMFSLINELVMEKIGFKDINIYFEQSNEYMDIEYKVDITFNNDEYVEFNMTESNRLLCGEYYIAGKKLLKMKDIIDILEEIASR